MQQATVAFGLLPLSPLRGNYTIDLWGHQVFVDFPGGSAVKNPPANAVERIRSLDLLPWRREWQPTPIFLPGESHGQRSLVGYSPWGCKESDMTE